MVGAFVQQPMHQRRVAVEGEDHWFVGGEQFIERGIRKAMGMLEDNCSTIKSTTLITRTRRSGTYSRSKVTAARVSRVGVAGAGHHHVRFLIVVARPVPTTDPGHAMAYGPSLSSHCHSGCLPTTMTFT